MNVSNHLRLQLKRSWSWILALLFCAGLVFAGPRAFSQSAQASKPPTPAELQRSQAWAREKLANSPRHQEWVTISGGNRTLKAFLTYPKVEQKLPVVLVLHEVFGLTDSTRNTADEIAAMGYIVIAPDMLSGYGPNGGDSGSFPTSRVAAQTLTGLSDEVVDRDLDAWADFGNKLPNANGTFAIVGLSWGGGAAFRYVTATHRKDLKIVCVFYDVGPRTDTLVNISVPVYGFYGSNDARVMSTLQATKDGMAAAGKVYEPVVYDADHAFMRLGEDPSNTNPANAVACTASLARLANLLKHALA
jgi:carboxymethylenebutenolidase